MACLEYYTTKEWLFWSRNPVQLMDKMSDEDRDIFYFDVRQINWHSYIKDYVVGIRKYLLKDDLSTLPVARRNLKKYCSIIDFRIIVYKITPMFYSLQDAGNKDIFSSNAFRIGNFSLVCVIILVYFSAQHHRYFEAHYFEKSHITIQ